MNRRRFNQIAMTAVLTHGIFPGASGSESDTSLDRYGGWQGKKFEATGFFRTEHDGTRWWLVSPEGNAFLSFGVNHLHSNWWQQEFSRTAWEAKLGVDDLEDWSVFAPALRAWFLETWPRNWV